MSIKRWVTYGVSEWQGHLLSCPGQLKRPRSLVKKDQVKRRGGLSDFVSVKSLKLHMTYCLPRFLDQNRKREDKIRILDTEKVSWNSTSNLHLDKTCFTVEKSEEDKVIKQWAEGGRGWGVTTNTKKPQLILIYWYSWLSCYGQIYWLLYDLWISTIWNISLMAGTILRW